MASPEELNNLLRNHPIFSPPKDTPLHKHDNLELSTLTLTKFVDTPGAASARRQTMVLKDADLIVAAGNEVRMSTIGDSKLSQSVRKSYKVLHTPIVQFEITQISINPSGKLLAVAGTHQVAVIVLPRPGYNRLVPEAIDCKAVQVGQFYHAAKNSPGIAKIDWHPWGEAGSTLLVMTVDGKLREYDISVDTEEPQQVLTFVPERKSRSYIAEDNSEREVASFTLGRGYADWGPLTMYAVMKSGDIYSICPYMPANASIPSAYIHSLECFIAAKQEFLSQDTNTSKNLSTIYDYQRKYVTALTKQLPPGTVFPATSRTVAMHPPTTISFTPLRQGPFLLQPSPRNLEGSEGGDATDIAYLNFSTDRINGEANDTERLGVIVVAYQDGRVDLFLDVEKVEARWDFKKHESHGLPMLAVYETIDLGTFQTLKDADDAVSLLQGNNPTFLLDPMHDDMLYVYHAFGVHAIDLSPVIEALVSALQADDDDDSGLEQSLSKAVTSNVQPILSTYSVQRRSSSPVIGVALPNDAFLPYGIFILNAAMRINTFSLNIRSPSVPDVPPKAEATVVQSQTVAASTSTSKSKWYTPPSGPPSYLTLLATPYEPPSLLKNSLGLPAVPKVSSTPSSQEFLLTPETLRYLGTAADKVLDQFQQLTIAYREATQRMSMQQQEIIRQSKKCEQIEESLQKLKEKSQPDVDARIATVNDNQKQLMARFDRILQAMMEKASPSLSEHESKWFEELKRMKEDIMGAGRYDEESLLSRTQTLEKEYARVLPALKTLLEQEESSNRRRFTESSLGLTQAFTYGERSNQEQTKILALTKQVSELAVKVDLPLTRPPQ